MDIDSIKQTFKTSPSVLLHRVSPLSLKCVEVLMLQDAVGFKKITEEYFEGSFTKVQVLYNAKQEMIGTIFFYLNFSFDDAYIYGTYVRNAFDKKISNEINICLQSNDDIMRFIKEISQYYQLDVFQKPEREYLTVCIQNIEHPEIVMEINLSCDPTMSGLKKDFDFDVNMLKISKPSLKITSLELFNDKCNILDIINNIYHKKFIVLDANGAPTIKHINCFVTPIFDANNVVIKFLINPEKYNSDRNCISRSSLHGQLILQKKIEMEKMDGLVSMNNVWTLRVYYVRIS